MGCFFRILGSVCFFLVAFLCFSLFLGACFFSSESMRAAEEALTAPQKDLSAALTSDGPAWIKVKLDVASGSDRMLCGGQPALWIRTERFEPQIEDIRSQGAWVQRNAVKQVSDEKKVVPMALTSGSSSLIIRDWNGIEIRPDLLRIRSDEAPLTAEAPVTASGDAIMRSRIQESYLPAGTEAWVLGKFERGIPKVYVNGKFYLTGLGPERFSKELSDREELTSRIRWAAGAASLIFLLLSVYFLLKRAK